MIKGLPVVAFEPRTFALLIRASNRYAMGAFAHPYYVQSLSAPILFPRKQSKRVFGGSPFQTAAMFFKELNILE